MSLESIVYQSTQQLLPSSPTLPLLIRSVFSGFHWFHSTWLWYRLGKTYHPDNFLKLTTGHALNFAVGDNRYVRLAAQCVMISNCILVSVKEQTALNRSYKKLTDAIFDLHPTIKVHKWNKQAISPFISPSTSHKVYAWLFHVESYLRTIAFRVAMFIKHFVKLSGAIIDAVDAFSLKAENSNRAVSEFFVNGNNCIDALAGNRDELIGKLNENKEIINTVLTTIKAPCKAEQFISYVDRSVSKVQTASQTLAQVNKAAGTVVTESLKTLFFLMMSSVGASSSVPDRLVPTHGLFGCSNEDSGNRFAPICRLNINKHKTSHSLFQKINYVNKPVNSLGEAYDQALNCRST